MIVVHHPVNAALVFHLDYPAAVAGAAGGRPALRSRVAPAGLLPSPRRAPLRDVSRAGHLSWRRVALAFAVPGISPLRPGNRRSTVCTHDADGNGRGFMHRPLRASRNACLCAFGPASLRVRSRTAHLPPGLTSQIRPTPSHRFRKSGLLP